MGKGNDPNCEQATTRVDGVASATYFNLFAIEGAAMTPMPAQSVSYCRERAVVALRSIRDARAFLAEQPADEKDAMLRAQLDGVEKVAVLLSVSRPEAGEMGVHRALFDRRVRRLAVAVTHCSQARAIAGILKDLLLSPTFSDREYQAAREAHQAWLAQTSLGDPDRPTYGPARPAFGSLSPAAQMNPRQGPLFEIASPDPDNCTLDEALVMAWQIEALSENMRQLADDHGGEDQAAVISSYLAPVQSSIRSLRAAINLALRNARSDSLEPIRVRTSVDDARMLVAVGTLLQRHFLAGDGSMTLMREARRVGATCAQALEEANGIPAPDASFLPTLTREEFETVFPYHVETDSLRGAYMPKLNMVTLSPGHSRMLLDPEWTPEDKYGKLLQRVHLHELAHATANNVSASRRDPLEVALGEGYAEVTSARAATTVAIDLSLTQGRAVRYAESEAYQAETELISELIGNPEHQDDPVARQRLARLANARSMVVAAAQILHDGDPRDDRAQMLHPVLMKDTRSRLIAYLRGNPQPLRERLRSIQAAAA